MPNIHEVELLTTEEVRAELPDTFVVRTVLTMSNRPDYAQTWPFHLQMIYGPADHERLAFEHVDAGDGIHNASNVLPDPDIWTDAEKHPVLDHLLASLAVSAPQFAPAAQDTIARATAVLTDAHDLAAHGHGSNHASES